MTKGAGNTMYRCFEGIPLDIRQEAFDKYAQLTKGQSGPNRERVQYDGYYCCPLGVLNHVVYKRNLPGRDCAKIAENGDILAIFSLPVLGKFEVGYLGTLGLDLPGPREILADGFDTFMGAVDFGWSTMTQEEFLFNLADRMGVKYQPESER